MVILRLRPRFRGGVWGLVGGVFDGYMVGVDGWVGFFCGVCVVCGRVFGLVCGVCWDVFLGGFFGAVVLGLCLGAGFVGQGFWQGFDGRVLMAAFDGRV